MKNLNLEIFNALVESTEGLEVNFKVGKECELNIKGDFKAMVKLVGIVLEKESIESREREKKDMNNFKSEIDVRGMRVDEALQAVMYFVDDAQMLSIGKVRILHGTGTGALRQAIRDYLNGSSAVATYRDEHVQFGGAGITVIELK